jgi:hypothetical protein
MNASNGTRQDSDGRARPTERSFGARRSVAGSIIREISALDPGYFALVMATGIVSNGSYLQEQRVISDALFVVGVACESLFDRRPSAAPRDAAGLARPPLCAGLPAKPERP